MARQVLASLLWLGSGNLLGQIVSWLSTLLVIRLLSPDDYGLIAMAYLPIAFLLLIGDLGASAVVIQVPTLTQAKLRALFAATMLTTLLASLVTFAAAPLVSAFFAEPRLTPLVRVLSWGPVLAGLAAIPQALLARDLRFDRKAKVDVLATVLAAMVGLALALAGWGAWALAGTMLAGQAVRAVAFQIVRPCVFLSWPSFGQLRESVGFGGWITLDRILWFGYTNLDVAIAGRALGGALLGTYSVALALASIPLSKVMSVVTEVSFPAFSRVQDDRAVLERRVRDGLESVSLLAFPTFLGMAVVAPEIVEIFLGPRWAGATVLIQIFSLVFPFRAVGLLFAPMLFGVGRPRVVVENNAITLGCVAVALVIGVRWGVVGLCIGWLLGYLPAFCVITYRTLAALDVSMAQVSGALGFALTAALTMALAMILTRAAIGEAWPAAAVLGSLVVVGAAVYGMLVLAFRRDILRTLRLLSQEGR